MNKLIHGDALEVLKTLPDKSVDLIVNDPPYNIGKSKEWDKWKKRSDYIDWCGAWITECQRVLKDNGSFYFFHNDFLQIVELQNWINKNSKFVFKQFIVWNKRFEGARGEGLLNWRNYNNGFRNYSKMAEYILFYTFQDETGLSTVYDDGDCFRGIKDYLRLEKERAGLTNQKLSLMFSKYFNKVGCLNRSVIEHYFQNTQWVFPTKKIYENILQKTGYFKRPYESLRQEYESLRQEYESLRQEYESLRYTFNNQHTHHSVWNYDTATVSEHITPKPVPLIENILKYSSNEGDVVLDCFGGSGTTAIACMNTNRRYILIEKDRTYYELAKTRIERHQPLLCSP